MMNKVLTEIERMSKAREWRDAAIARRRFAQHEIARDPCPLSPVATANEAIADSMTDRILLIEALFPELREG